MIPKTSLTTITRSLIHQGLIVRENNSRDERKFFLTISPEGEALVHKLYKRNIKAFEQLFRELPDEKRDRVIEGFEILNEFFESKESVSE